MEFKATAHCMWHCAQHPYSSSHGLFSHVLHCTFFNIAFSTDCEITLETATLYMPVKHGIWTDAGISSGNWSSAETMAASFFNVAIRGQSSAALAAVKLRRTCGAVCGINFDGLLPDKGTPGYNRGEER